MMRQRIASLSLAVLAAIAVVGCSGAASPAGSVASPAPSTEPSVAAPSETASAAPSLLLPSFSLPSSDKELEALLPDTVCGLPAVKLSMTGSDFEAAADPEFKAVLDKLGKTADDVSFAVAGGGADCAAGVFRVKGADPNKFREYFIDESIKTGATYTEAVVGGKAVLVATDADFGYGYFKGDALFFVTAPTEAEAAEILAALP